MILLDTHVLIWVGSEKSRLGEAARRTLHREELGIASISFWEIAMLVAQRRLILDGTPTAFRRAALDQGVQELTMDGAIGIEAVGLVRFHHDPADRIIVATAKNLDVPLLTADERILAWRGGLRTQDARR